MSAALVWGLAFVAQKDAAGGIGVFTFIFARSIVTCLALLPVYLMRDAVRRKDGKKIVWKNHLLPGFIMGLLTFSAIYFQQWGLETTSAGKSGFITALYIVIVPLLTLLFFRRKLPSSVWVGVAFAVLGSAFLALDFSERITVGFGELITFLCAIAFSTHIVFVDTKTEGLDSVVLCFLQFGVCMVFGFAGMLLFEEPSWGQFAGNWLPILYVGGISGAIGYTFQLVGQKYAEPSVASLTMCMESVFAALGGWLIGGEILKPLEYLGCVLMLAGCLLAQRPGRKGV